MAQGVPVGDYKKIALEVLGIATDRERSEAERDHTAERVRQNARRDEQLEAVEETLRLLTETSRFVPDLEGAGIGGGAGGLIGAAEIYAIDDNNPYAGRIMGDAPLTIEQMISDTSARYAGHPALSRAGMRPGAWSPCTAR